MAIKFGTTNQGGAGTVTGAESGTGLVSGKVRLGINPLLQDTSISQGAFLLEFDSAGSDGSVSSFVNFSGGALMVCTDPNGNGAELIAQGFNQAESHIAWFQAGTGNTTGIFNNQLQNPGLYVQDVVSNVGLIGQVLFPKNDPNQYLQVGDIPVKTDFAKTGQTVSTNITTLVAPIGADSMYRISTTLFLLTASGLGINVNVTWNDPAGNSKTILLVSGTLAENYAGTSQNIYVQAGSTISIDTLVSGSNVYDVLGTFELLI